MSDIIDEKTIGVLPMGNIPGLVPKIIAANISACFDLSAQVLPALDVPQTAFDKRRLQYDAGKILRTLESMRFDGYTKVVGLLNEDLFVPIFSYVYGEARQGADIALVSLFRLDKNLDGSFSPPELLFERAAKVALHELGHLFNLYHCNEEKCLMHFSGDIADLDKSPLYFCRYCLTFLPDQA